MSAPDQPNLNAWTRRATQLGIPIRGNYGIFHVGFFAWANLNEMTWEYAQDLQGNDGILALVCRDVRITKLVPELGTLLAHEHGPWEFHQNMPQALKDFVPSALRTKLREDPHYEPPILATAMEAKRLLKQAGAGAYIKQCELATVVLERSAAKITEQQAADERAVEDMIRQAKCREEERTKQQNTLQQNLTHVKQQELVAEEVLSEVKAAQTRFDLLERAANCGSRSADCTTWRSIAKSALKHFNIPHDVKNEIIPSAILETYSAGIVAEQTAQMATNAQDNFIGAVVDGKVLNDDAMDGDTALADAAAMADDIAKDSNLKPAADPVANDKVAPKVQLLATNDQSNGEGFAVGLNNLKSSPEMNPSKKHVPAVSLESSSQSFNSFVLDDLSLKPNEDATSTNPSS
mmetsp:Transcript_20255/g.48700  ORF Transcript_20255/g.48700 Transcript_20255/m.48700 type:complete len:406 (-) Transcript_20255:338-1555(-)